MTLFCNLFMERPSYMSTESITNLLGRSVNGHFCRNFTVHAYNWLNLDADASHVATQTQAIHGHMWFTQNRHTNSKDPPQCHKETSHATQRQVRHNKIQLTATHLLVVWLCNANNRQPSVTLEVQSATAAAAALVLSVPDSFVDCESSSTILYH